MKNFKRVFTIILSMVLIAGYGCLTAFAAGEGGAQKDEYGDTVYKATYTITVYSGKEGNFGGSTVKTAEASYGDTVTINLDGGITVAGSSKGNLDFAVNDGSKYYARGLKIAGHDNDETSGMGYRTINATVTGDQSYSVAYGLKGGMVKYTVNYIDQNGNALHPSAEYYGMPGDYPVLSYQYVEGYAPNAYNLGKTLSANEADNVFTFTYAPSTLTAEEQAALAAQPVAGAANAAAGNANANAGADGNANANAGANNADGTNIGDNATPAAGAPNVVDLDNGEVPQAQPNTDVDKSELAGQKTKGIAIAAACAAALAGAAYAVVKRRSGDDEDDEDEE